MQHPILTVVEGDRRSVDELEREALEDLVAVIDRHLLHLPPSSSWRAAFAGMRAPCAQALRLPHLQLARPVGREAQTRSQTDG